MSISLCGNCRECGAKNCPRRINRASGEFFVVTDFDYIPKTADGIFIDIGTTTIAASRIEGGQVTEKFTCPNPQRQYGADVISRIGLTNASRQDEIMGVLKETVDNCIARLGDGGKVYLCGNTAMVNMYLGNDCTKMGMYPFIAPDLDGVANDDKIIPPSASAFIGADIVSGLYMCDFHKNEKVNILIDLGTNAEMAIGNKDRIMALSAAAGPAFEGGRISCGVASVAGAVSFVSLENMRISTIGNGKPTGLCGTGLIDLVAELLRIGYIDETGRMKDDMPYELVPGIELTQLDVREIQTAKSAIRSGIEILVKKYGECEIGTVFVSGGFGKFLNFDNACRIGLLPDEFRGKYKAVGNSALGGLVKLSEHEDGQSAMESIKKVTTVIEPNNEPEFNDLFLDNMYFKM